MLGKERMPFEYDALHVGDEITTDPAAIHKQMSDFFQAWFVAPDPALRSGIHSEEVHWATLFTDKAAFLAHGERLSVPTPLTEAIWAAINFPTTLPRFEEAKERLRTVFSTPPTCERFLALVKRGKARSSPGPTGLTYNMMKHWPEELTVEVYHLLSAIHQRGEWATYPNLGSTYRRYPEQGGLTNSDL